MSELIINLRDEEIELCRNMVVATAETIYPVNIVETVEAKAWEEQELTEHLQGILEKCQSNLDAEQLESIKKLILKCMPIFATTKTGIGQTNIVKQRINSETELENQLMK